MQRMLDHIAASIGPSSQAFIEQVGSESLKDHVALPIADFTDSRAGNATTLFFASADFLGFRISLLLRR